MKPDEDPDNINFDHCGNCKWYVEGETCELCMWAGFLENQYEAKDE